MWTWHAFFLSKDILRSLTGNWDLISSARKFLPPKFKPWQSKKISLLVGAGPWRVPATRRAELRPIAPPHLVSPPPFNWAKTFFTPCRSCCFTASKCLLGESVSSFVEERNQVLFNLLLNTVSWFSSSKHSKNKDNCTLELTCVAFVQIPKALKL